MKVWNIVSNLIIALAGAGFTYAQLQNANKLDLGGIVILALGLINTAFAITKK